MKKIIFASFAVVACCNASAQKQDSAWQVVGTDTVNVKVMDPILISAGMDEKGREEYQKLKRRVKKVMPFAKMAAYKMQVMEDNLGLKKGKKKGKSTSKSARKA